MDLAAHAENMDLILSPDIASASRDQATSTSPNQNQADASTQTQPRFNLPPNQVQATNTTEFRLLGCIDAGPQPRSSFSTTPRLTIADIRRREQVRILEIISLDLFKRQKSIKENRRWPTDPVLRKEYNTYQSVQILIQGLRINPAEMEAAMAPSSCSDRMAIPKFIENIYYDLRAYADGYGREQISMVHIEIGEVRDYFRFHHTARHDAVRSLLIWPVFRYLLLSKTFMCAATVLDQTLFTSFLKILNENTASLMVFARVRLPKITGMDETLRGPFQCYLGVSRKKDVNFYMVPGEGQPLIIRPTFGASIDNNIFDMNDFRCVDAPPGWSDSFPWPSHPGKRHPGTTCFACQSTSMCSCAPPDADLAMVEVYDYGTRGRGVRTLRRLDSAGFVGEFVGRFYPISAETDDTWTISFRNPPANEPFNYLPLAKLDASSEGNWTRFINNHCSAPNVVSTFVNMGGYRRIIFKALRNIEVYEELLVTYTSDYWERHVCHCGSEFCVGSTALIEPKANQANPPQGTDNTGKTTAPNPPVNSENGSETKKSYLMPTQIHSDISDSASESKSAPLPPLPRSTRTKKATKQSLNQNAATTDNKEEQDKTAQASNKFGSLSKKEEENGAQRHAEALARRADKRDARRGRKEWEKRWIGQENADKPRSKGAKSAGPYFAEF